MTSAMSDMAGTADNCSPVRPSQFGDAAVAESLTYLRVGETPYIFLKSKVFEWIFTDLALVKIERENAAGIKRIIRRHEWFCSDLRVESLKFTTAGAGLTDFSCHIEFDLGSSHIDIEVVKSETEYAKLVYHCLSELAVAQARNKQMLGAATTLRQQILVNATDTAAVSNLLVVASQDIVNAYDPISYAQVFQRCMTER